MALEMHPARVKPTKNQLRRAKKKANRDAVRVLFSFHVIY
jgi:hypothetical protein